MVVSNLWSNRVRAMSGSVSLAFVDSHPIVVDALKLVFSANQAFEIVASGRCVSDAMQIARSIKPDVLVIDPEMQGDAYAAISVIAAECRSTKVVAFSAAINPGYAVRALEAGASGYVLKSSAVHVLEEAITRVVGGETFIPTTFASSIVDALRDTTKRKRAAEAIKLSIREEQIVRHLLRGSANKEIAKTLSISERTVKHYMTILMHKLSARNRTEAVIAAQKFMMTNPAGLNSAGEDLGATLAAVQ